MRDSSGYTAWQLAVKDPDRQADASVADVDSMEGFVTCDLAGLQHVESPSKGDRLLRAAPAAKKGKWVCRYLALLLR